MPSKQIIKTNSKKLAEEKGFDNVMLNNIAENLGVKLPSLYKLYKWACQSFDRTCYVSN